MEIKRTDVRAAAEAPVRHENGALLRFFIDYITAALICAGIAAALCALTGYERPTLAALAAAIAAIAVTEKKWWLLPGALAAGLVLGLLFHLAAGTAGEYTGRLTGFALWLLEAMPASKMFSTDFDLLLGEALTLLPLAALTSLFVRRIFSMAALAALTAGLTVWMFYVSREMAVPTLAPLLAACVISLPRVYARALRRRGCELPRHSLQYVAVPVAGLCLLLALTGVPQGDDVWRSRLLSGLAGDIRDALELYSGAAAGERSPFGIGHNGYMPLGDRLGGDIYPEDNILFRVSTDHSVYLAGSVQDVYTGSNWYDAPYSGHFRTDSLLWRARFNAAFGANLPRAGREAKALMDEVTGDVTCRVHGFRRYYTMLFSLSGLRSVRFPATGYGKVESDIYFNPQGELFLAGYRQVRDVYELQGVEFLQDSAGFGSDMRRLTQIAAGGRDPAWDDIAERCTALPASLPDSVRALTADITAGLELPYEKAAAIEQWLSENCTYTTTPGDPPADRDFVDWFLETRQGYCTYYASAMAVMARCAGMPSRYVTGFAMRRDAGSASPNAYIVCGDTAHAWCEVYFRGVGWVTFDPLGWDDSPIIDETEEAVDEPTIALPDSPPDDEEEQDEDEPSGSPLGQLLDEGYSSLSVSDRISVNFAIGGTVIGLGLLAVICVWAVRRVMDRYFRLFTYRRLAARYDAAAQVADVCYSDIVVQLGYWSVTLAPGETVSAFCARMDRLDIAGEPDVFSRLGAAIERFRYGGLPLTREEAEEFCRIHALLEGKLLSALGKREYFFRRAARKPRL